ncbi:MAG: hypothetical protein V4615_01885 [Bacteroidota bacterium]
MKAIKVTIGSALPLLATFSSDNKECTLCEKGSEPDVRLCKNDYSNHSQYRQAIIGKETAGFSCHN